MEKEKVVQYISQMRPVFNKSALFSDETKYYREPCEPDPGDTVTIRFRTLKNNVDAVYFISGVLKERMELEKTVDGFDYYTVSIPVGQEDIHYFFEIQSGKIVCYYNKLGVTRELREEFCFGIIPGFHTPEWAKGAVMYQIFVDRFCNGDPSNDVLNGEYCYINEPTREIDDWYKDPEAMDVRCFYGGDLQGVMDKLDYLQDLGVEVIYLNPIFVSPSNHKYDIQDYDYVDPHFGKIVKDEGELLLPGEKENRHASRYICRVTDPENLEASNRFFAELVEEIHRRGMKVILDGVFNHCGSFNKWLDRERIYEHQPGYEKGAYITGESPYHSFFKFYNEHDWPYNEFYDGWWGHNTLPKLNYEASTKLTEYIMRIARKWVSPPYNVDGWRLDVAADLGHSEGYNHLFWKEFRRNVKEANPNAVVLAEHYGDSRQWLQGDEWDTIMNYDAFMEPISWFLTGMEKHSDEFRQDLLGNSGSFIDTMRYRTANFYAPSLQMAMNQLSNHDHSRFLTRTNHRVGRVGHLGPRAAEDNVNKAVMREAVVIQMTWPGAPTLYYGDEAGLCGFTDPDNRRSYPWGHEDRELLEFHKDIIRIHRQYPVFTHGSVKFIYQDYNILGYARFSMEDRMLVLLNNRNEKVTLEVPVWQAGISRSEETTMQRIFYSNAIGYSMEEQEIPVVAGYVRLEMDPLSAIILHKDGK